MQKILVIGCGELGSRHLQSLYKDSKICHEREIHVVDSSDTSISLAKARISQVKSFLVVKVFFYNSIDELEEKVFDFVLISTSATNRLEIIRKISSDLNFTNLLLEKVLFQSAGELSQAKSLLENKGINAYVNCPRRYFGHYRKIKDLITQHERLNMTVKGTSWGLACNAVHFIDLFFFLTKEEGYDIDLAGLESTIINSKREGFKEVVGSIFVSKGYSTLQLECQIGDINSLEVHIHAGEYTFTIDEVASEVRLYKNGHETNHGVLFDAKYQSDMTGFICDDIVKNNQCVLTSFEESYTIHFNFLDSMLIHFKETVDKNLQKCPIT